MNVLSAAEKAAFDRDGFVRVPGAFSSSDAAAMRDVVWTELARRGIERHDRSTWTVPFPDHLQHLRKRSEFRAIGSERTLGAIDDLLGESEWTPPRDWGAFFLTFPAPEPWNVPARGWHIDAPYDDPLDPPHGLKVHAIFGDIAPRAGGMPVIAGSHRAVSSYFARDPVRPNDPAARTRKRLLASHPWFVALQTDGEPRERIANFMEREADVFGAPVRVVELAASAGDVILRHPPPLHALSHNARDQPRVLLPQAPRTHAGAWVARPA
jgi:ectoine hydroxylase-related dioxygenase (phytanoyl-CoA dioxygenase family)